MKENLTLLGLVVDKRQGEDASHYTIRGQGGDCDAHYSDIYTEAFRHLEVGDRVRYRRIESESGPKAIYIIRLPNGDEEDWLYGY